MKRNLGIGDIVFGSGWLLVFVFVFLCIVLKGGDGGMVYGEDTSWPLVNGIILLAVIFFGSGGLFAYSFLNPKMVNLQYIFAGFLILLHIAQFQVLMPYKVAHAGMPFYIFVGALLMGLGTYMIQQGAGAIMGGHKGK
jgi:hypothetical protein